MAQRSEVAWFRERVDGGDTNRRSSFGVSAPSTSDGQPKETLRFVSVTKHFNAHLVSRCPPQWKGDVLPYKSLLRELMGAITKATAVSAQDNSDGSDEGELDEISTILANLPEYRAYIERLDAEVERIDEFYLEQCAVIVDRLSNVRAEVKQTVADNGGLVSAGPSIDENLNREAGSETGSPPRATATTATNSDAGSQAPPSPSARLPRTGSTVSAIDAVQGRGDFEADLVWGEDTDALILQIQEVALFAEQCRDFGYLCSRGIDLLLRRQERMTDALPRGVVATYRQSSFATCDNLTPIFARIKKTMKDMDRVAASEAEPDTEELAPAVRQQVDELPPIESLPPGQSTFWLEMGRNQLGLPIQVPVIIFRGCHVGPVVGITAAIHGNELNGVPVLFSLLNSLDKRELYGAVVAVTITNPIGYQLNSRYFSGGVDLNRAFPGRETGDEAAQFCATLLTKIISKFDVLIDLHTASFGRVNSLYVRGDMNDPVVFRMAVQQHPQVIVHNTGPDGSLRGAAGKLNIPAITVEIADAQQFQKVYYKHALKGLQNVLSSLCLVNTEVPVLSRLDPVMCSKSYWTYTDAGGLLTVLPEVATFVDAGEVVAVLRDPFGELIATYTAPESGVVIGKNVNPSASNGHRIIHIGVVAKGSFASQVDDGHR